ncbi:MAG: DUF1501 domain-containing protein [Limisphaerales bacterium]
MRTEYDGVSRREFLRDTSCGAMGTATFLSTLLNLKMANNAAAAGLGPGDDCRTVVCIYLSGGIDSFNLIVPTDSARYADYQTSRGNLALPTNTLLPLNQTAGGDGLPYGVHPAAGPIQEMFNGLGGNAANRRLAFISNVGTLLQPTTKAEYRADNFPLPKSLFSHIDQTEQWQTSLPQGGNQLTGWAGRAADVLHSTMNTQATSMSISFTGNNIFQVGNSTQQFVVTPSGALTFTGASQNNANHPVRIKNSAITSLMEQEYSNLVERAFAQLTRRSVDEQAAFQHIFEGFDDNSVTTNFPDTHLGRQLFAALKSIATRPQLGLRRQTIMVSYGGWDHHGELLQSQDARLRELAPAMLAFQQGLEELNLQDSVVTFCASEFARTLRSNGQGTDHAWGGNAMVYGAPVQGGRLYGTFPSVALDSNDDVGRGGRLVPSMSVDEMFADILRWFGVSTADLPTVLPNLGNFHSGNGLPVGFINPASLPS